MLITEKTTLGKVENRVWRAHLLQKKEELEKMASFPPSVLVFLTCP